MEIENIRKKIGGNLKTHLDLIVPNHSIKEGYEYSLFPTGKLFRPLLSYAITKDLGAFEDHDLLKADSPLAYLCSSLELHHTYTLIHDDLPCMDNDDFRRGRPSLHKAYCEWKALLIGDGLLNASYQLLAKIESKNVNQIIGFYSQAQGPKGLIQGQVYDLSEEMNQSFSLLMRTHELKTARPMQVAMVCAFLLLEDQVSSQYGKFRIFMDLFKLGSNLGKAFQILDDLSELTQESLSNHEKSINPWPNSPDATRNELDKLINNIGEIAEKHNLSTFVTVIEKYFQKIGTTIKENQATILKHLKDADPKNRDLTLRPVISLLEIFGLGD